MGLDFFVGEVQAQANEATRVAQAATEAVGLLQDSVNQFLNAPLSSKTYDTAKRYFSVAYSPLQQGGIQKKKQRFAALLLVLLIIESLCSSWFTAKH